MKRLIQGISNMLTNRSGLSTALGKKLPLAVFSGAFLATATACLAGNPFITSIYTADPSAHVWSDGRLYVYPSRDIDPPRGCDLMDRYHVYSTDDMVTWRDEGEILRASQVPWGRPEGGFMWAPDCAYKDGKYYFYFPHPSGSNWNNTWKIGIATSDKPAQGFTNAGFIPGIGGSSMIDPSVFVDTDGQAYLYYGGGSKCAQAKLKANMMEIDGAVQPVTGLEDFHEATRVFKRNAVYYLTYADNHPRHNRLRYATSSSPLGPWTSKGVYLDVTDCDTSHGSVVEYKGQWYAFYHNCSISHQGTLRSICVDRLDFDSDGNIKMVVQTKTGVPSVGVPSVGKAPAPNPKTVKYLAASATPGNGASIVANSAASSGQCVHNLHGQGAFMKFDAVDGGAAGGQATLDIRFAAAENAKLRLSVNGDDYSFINTLSTGGWDNYTGDSSLTVPLKPGKNNVVEFTGGHNGVDVDYMTVTPLPTEPALSQAPQFKVLAFYTGKSDLAHISFVNEANRWFPKMAAKHNFTYEATTNWDHLDAAYLAKYQVVLFLDTRPDGPGQRKAFEDYMEHGGAWIGFHFAGFALTPSAVPQNWDWYHQKFLGSGEYVSNTWRPTSAVLRVEDAKHPATSNLPATFKSAPNEWYRWKNDLRANPDIKVLLSIDPASFPLGTGPKPNEIWHSGDYPVAWTNKKYKMIYVNMGHNDMDYENKTNKELSFTFDNETQNQFIVDGLLWLGGGKKDDAAGSTRPSSSAQPQP